MARLLGSPQIDRVISKLVNYNISRMPAERKWHNVQAVRIKFHYDDMKTHCEHINFRDICKIPVAFPNQTALLSFFVWMMHKKISVEGHRDRNVIFEYFDDDVKTKMVYDLDMYPGAVNKQFMKIRKWLLGCYTAYDSSFIQLADGNDLPLIGTLFRNIYDSDPNLNKGHVVQLETYFVEQFRLLLELPSEQFWFKQVPWKLPPSVLPPKMDIDLGDHTKPI